MILHRFLWGIIASISKRVTPSVCCMLWVAGYWIQSMCRRVRCSAHSVALRDLFPGEAESWSAYSGQRCSHKPLPHPTFSTLPPHTWYLSSWFVFCFFFASSSDPDWFIERCYTFRVPFSLHIKVQSKPSVKLSVCREREHIKRCLVCDFCNGFAFPWTMTQGCRDAGASAAFHFRRQLNPGQFIYCVLTQAISLCTSFGAH